MHGTRKRERARRMRNLEAQRGRKEAWVSVGRRRFEKWEEAWISVAHRRWEAWSDAPWDGPGAQEQKRRLRHDRDTAPDPPFERHAGIDEHRGLA